MLPPVLLLRLRNLPNLQLFSIMISRLSTHALAILSGILLYWLFSDKPERSTANAQPETVAASALVAQRPAGLDGTAAATKPMQTTGSAMSPSAPTLNEILAMRDPVARLEALTKWAQDLAASGADGVQMLKTIKNKTLRQAAEAAFYTTLAQTDAGLAFHLASANGLSADNMAWGGLFESLTMQNPNDAAAALGRLPPGAMRSRLTGTVAGTWAEKDIGEAVKWASTLNAAEKSAALETIFEAGASKSASVAAAAALSLPAGKSRNDALGATANHMAMQNPDGAIAWADSLTGSDKEAAIRGVLSRLSSQDPKTAGQLLDKLPAGKSKRDLTQEIAGQMALNDTTEALAWLQQRGETTLAASVAPVLWVMGEQDPSAALTTFQASLANPSLADQAAHLAESLVQKSGGEEAMAKAMALTDNAARQSMVEKIAQQWALVDPAAAWQKAQQSPELLGAMIPALASAAPTLVEQNLAALPQSVQSQVAPFFAGAMAQVDPAGAARLLGNHPSNDPSWADAVNAVSSAWADHDPSAAAAASLGMNGALGESIRSKAVASWLGEDVTGACAWIQKLPQGTTKDAAIATLVQYAITTDPHGASSWLPLVSDPSTRASLQQQLALVQQQIR